MRYTLLLGCLIHLVPVFSQQTFTLQQAIAYAQQNSYAARLANTDVQAAQKKVNETTSIGLPQVNAEGSFQNFIDIPTQVIPANAFNPMASPDELMPVQFGTKFNSSASITATQLIFDGSYIVGLQAAKTYKDLAEKARAKTASDIKELVTQAYFTVLISEENLRVVDSSLQVVKRNYQEVEAFYKTGFSEEQDAEQLKLTVNNLQNIKNRTEKQTDLAYRMLKFQMGYPIEQPMHISDKVTDMLNGFNAENIMGNQLQVPKNYEYSLLETQKRLYELNLKKERFAYLPNLSAFFTHQQNAFRNEFNFFENRPWYPATIWGLKMNLPIFDSGIKMSKSAQARLDIDKIEIQQTQLEQSLVLRSLSLKADFLTAYEKVGNETENLQLAEKIYNKTNIKYKQGLASSLELSQAHTQWLTAQGNYIAAVYDLLHAKNQLDKLFQH